MFLMQKDWNLFEIFLQAMIDGRSLAVRKSLLLIAAEV